MKMPINWLKTISWAFSLSVEFLVLCDPHADPVENLPGGQLLFRRSDIEDSSAFLNEVFQLILIHILPVFRCQETLVGKLGQLSLLGAKCLVQVEKLKSRWREIREDWREHCQLQLGQRDLELRLDDLQRFVLDVQLLVGGNNFPQGIIVDGMQMHVEHFLEICRNLAIYRLHQADFGLIGQVDSVGCESVIKYLQLKPAKKDKPIRIIVSINSESYIFRFNDLKFGKKCSTLFNIL